MKDGRWGVINFVLRIFQWVSLLQRAYLIFTIKTKSHHDHRNKKKKKEKIFKTQTNLAYVYMLSSPHPLFLSGFQNNLEIFIYKKKAERKRQ